VNTHRNNPADIADQPDTHENPPRIPARDVVRYGREGWSLGKEGDLGVLAEGHDRRALAAISAHARHEYGPRWAADLHAPIAEHHWVLIRETCGCTPDQHTAHLDQDRDDPDWDGCPCPHGGLPPCEPDRFAWLAEPAAADTPGAIAVTEVTW